MSAESQTEGRDDLVEIWQDVVSTRHLLWSVGLGIVLGMGGYVGGHYLLDAVKPDLDVQLAKGYALFSGVGGCLLASVIACVLFKPKRVLTSAVVEDQQILEALKDEGISPEEELQALRTLPTNVKRELEEVGVYDQMVRILEAKKE